MSLELLTVLYKEANGSKITTHLPPHRLLEAEAEIPRQ
jgi:hypothetical protein